MRVSTKRIAALAALAVAAPLWGMLAEIASAADLPSYKPPSRGAPSSRIGGGTRGLIPPRQIWALAPDHTGLTTREQPSLYWYVAKPVTSYLELTAMNDPAAKPLLELTIAPSPSAGVQRIDLARHGVRLQPGVEYRWYVSFDGDSKQRSNNGRIERVAPSAALAKRLEATPKAGQPAVYAEEGLWYDAIAAIGELIEQSPNDADLHRQRAALLEQVGLPEAAVADVRR